MAITVPHSWLFTRKGRKSINELMKAGYAVTVAASPLYAVAS